jgi:hypothetical protein
MASSVFLDTSGWLALLNATEGMHSQANSVWFDLGARAYRVVLTDWVIAETGNGSSRLRVRSRFVDAVQQLRQSPSVELVIVDEQLLTKSIEYYHRHSDKSWGLVDCSSFIVMRDRGMRDAFTSDRHFEQAGFSCLLTI